MRLIAFIALIAIIIAGCSKQETPIVTESENQQIELNAQPECPRGMSYDPEPGICAAYVDTNNNGYCDLSE